MTKVIRALVWKEWREQRSLLLSGLLLAAVLPLLVMSGATAMSIAVDPSTLAGALPAILLFLLCPLFCAAAGASTIAGEIGEGTLGFLLSRPASRSLVWTVKVGLAGAVCLLMAAGALLLSWLYGALSGLETVEPYIRTISRTSPEGLYTLVAGAAAAFLLFCCSVFFSGVIGRPMAAAAAALAAWIALLAALVVLWSRLDLVPRLEPEWFAGEMFLAGLLVLASSLYLFARGETLRGRAARGRAAVSAASALLAMTLVSLPLFHARTRLSPEEAVLRHPILSRSGEAVIATASFPDAASPQVWLIHPSGGDVERLAGRLAYGHAVSPDGAWVAYLSQRGWFGLIGEQPVLWAVSAGGSGAHPLAPLQSEYREADWLPPVAFSPDSRMAAALSGGVLVVATVSGDRPAQTISTPLEPGHRFLLGWTSSGSEVLLLAVRQGPPPSWTLQAVDADSGMSRTVHAGSAAVMSSPRRAPQGGWTRVPLWVLAGSAPARPIELVLVDPETGAADRISSEACFGVAEIARESDPLYYATCGKDADGSRRSSLRRRDLSDGTDTTVATVEGQIHRVLASPDGRRLIVARLSSTGSSVLPAIVVTEEGGTRELEAGWTPLGWSGRRRVVLADDAWKARRLALLDLRSGDLRPFYP